MNEAAPPRELPIWATETAFPPAPTGIGWADARKRLHPCTSETELLETIANDRAARVALVWTTESPRMILPEEWPAARDAVREGRRKRLADDLATASDRVRWFGILLGGIIVYMMYQGWTRADVAGAFLHRLGLAMGAAIRSMSVGLCLLMFLILGFIPWYQARKRQAEWKRGDAGEDADWLRVLRFETWLERQSAPATRWIMAMIGLVGLAQLLPGDSLQAAGLLKGGSPPSDWWRVYTAPFLHGNPLHFLMNAAALLYLGKRMEVFARWPHVPLVFLLSAAVGNEASLRLLTHPSLGASGGLLGWLGFLLVFESLHARLVPRTARKRLLAGVLLTTLIGVIGYQFIDNAAHAGGLLAGMLYALIVFPKSSSALRPRATFTDIIAGSLAMLALTLCAAAAVWKILSA